jgi:hypothetical protein
VVRGELSQVKRGPLKVFHPYAHQDEKARDTLDQHLELLSQRILIVRWHDRHIVSGQRMEQCHPGGAGKRRRHHQFGCGGRLSIGFL